MSSYLKKSRGSYGGNSLAGGGGVSGSIRGGLFLSFPLVVFDDDDDDADDVAEDVEASTAGFAVEAQLRQKMVPRISHRAVVSALAT